MRPVPKINNRREYPPEQIEWYLDKSRLDWGILTNGQRWLLVPRERTTQQRRFETYLEADLPHMLDQWIDEPGAAFDVLNDFMRFYLFFSPDGFRETVQRKSLVRRALEGSSEYRVGVGEGIKWRTFEALRICIEGLLSLDTNDLKAPHDLPICREQSFILLYRLLFVMFAEDRRLLPYKVNKTYTNNRSLGRLRDDIAKRIDGIRDRNEDDYDRNSTAIWDELNDLFDLIDKGKPSYGVPAYNGGLFDTEASPFLVEKKLSDWHVARVIDQLGRASDSEKVVTGLFRVDYRDLAIQHLGGIYEGLLEVHPHLASERMLVYAKREKGVWKEMVKPASEVKPEGYEKTEVAYAPGSIYLITDKGERRAFGSYYTPDHIVDAIVRRTLEPICSQIAEEQDFADRVLHLHVLDPAMGSGHFLLNACQYLAEEIATNPHTPSTPEDNGAGESAMAYWKRRVVENCLYGVDINPMAVELAKLALWLETVAANRPLTFLDHHLRHGNSLIGAKVSRLGSLPGEHGLFADELRNQLDAKLPALLKPLSDIRAVPSDNLDQVKQKGKRFAAFERAVSPFQHLADLWCASATGTRVTAEQYHSILDVVDKPKTFQKLMAETWFEESARKCRRKSQCFHWELAFPEVFFGDTGLLARPGFDAIIGNPPYEVLSEKESGMDLAPIRDFIDNEPSYKPSKYGKNNLYKIFICRSLDLLADGGYFGFIVPMALLGDEQSSELRKAMVQAGSFASIEAFPQKDRPDNRIFYEAKLSTAVFSFVKGPTGENARPFRSRVHPAQDIEASSPSLMLTTESIPLYDPNNFTIVSCDQADWDLATRIIASGRMGRLGEWTEFFQGEVNETNVRKEGHISAVASQGKLVTRGAGICLYVVRPASQGENLYLNVASFLRDKGPQTKAFHHRYRRIGVQESSPQNNFRRVIAAMIDVGEFCNHKINYLPEHTSKQALEFVLALLDSTLADWYFRLGSTNAAVSHYQLYNLPCPRFVDSLPANEAKILEKAQLSLAVDRTDQALTLLRPMLKKPPYSLVLGGAIIAAVKRIMAIEANRGEIARTERSALDPAAQPFQDFIDELFFGMAGLTEAEVSALKDRYSRML